MDFVFSKLTIEEAKNLEEEISNLPLVPVINAPIAPPSIIRKYEVMHGMKYICDTDIFLDDEWHSEPVALFYAKEKIDGTNWIGLSYYDGELQMIKADGALEKTSKIKAVRTSDGYMYSSCISHKRCYNGVCIGGGRAKHFFEQESSDTSVQVIDLVITPNGLQILQ